MHRNLRYYLPTWQPFPSTAIEQGEDRGPLSDIIIIGYVAGGGNWLSLLYGFDLALRYRKFSV